MSEFPDSRAAFRKIVDQVAPGFIEEVNGPSASETEEVPEVRLEDNTMNVIPEGLRLENEVLRWPERDPYDVEAIAGELLYGMFTLKADRDLNDVNAPALVADLLGVPLEAVEGIVYQMYQDGLVESVPIEGTNDTAFNLIANHPDIPACARADEIVIGNHILTRAEYTEIAEKYQSFTDRYRKLGDEAVELKAATTQLSHTIEGSLSSAEDGMF